MSTETSFIRKKHQWAADMSRLYLMLS